MLQIKLDEYFTRDFMYCNAKVSANRIDFI